MSKKRPSLDSQRRLELAEELETWSLTRKVAFDKYLKGVISALRSGEELATWAQYAPEDWLPRPRSHKARKMADIGRLIAIVRNVLIFFPVALTWFAIGSATRAFEKFLNDGGDSTANFLEFWQSGKGYLPEVWRIGNVATLDFQIILFLIVISLVSGILQARAIRVSGHDATKFEQERIYFTFEINELLTPYKTFNDSSVSKTALAMLEKLDRSVATMAKASEALVKATTALTPSVKQSSKEITKMASSAQKVTRELAKSVTESKKSLNALNRDIARKRKSL